jgi:translation initiation factor 2 subunit 1
VQGIYDYGAYVTLEEYGGLRAYLPWSEVSSKCVRSIRDVFREGQRKEFTPSRNREEN